MEELEEIVQRMMDENTPEEEIKKYIKDYKAGKLNGAAEKGATATPTPGAPENMVLESEDISLESQPNKEKQSGLLINIEKTLKGAKELDLKQQEAEVASTFEDVNKVLNLNFEGEVVESTPVSAKEINENAKSAKIGKALDDATKLSFKEKETAIIQAENFVNNNSTKNIKVKKFPDNPASIFINKQVPNDDWVDLNKTAKINVLNSLKKEYPNFTKKDFDENLNTYNEEILAEMVSIKNKTNLRQERDKKLVSVLDNFGFSLSLTEAQKELIKYKKKENEKLEKNIQNSSDFLNKAGSYLTQINNTIKKLAGTKYETQEQADAARGLVSSLQSKFKETQEAYSKKYLQAMDDIETSNTALSDLNILTRNYNPITNFVQSVKAKGAGQLAIGGLRLYETITNLPVEIGELLNVNSASDIYMNRMLQEPGYFRGAPNTAAVEKNIKLIQKWQEGIYKEMPLPQDFKDLKTPEEYGRYISDLAGSQLLNIISVMTLKKAALPVLGLNASGAKLQQFAEEQERLDAWKKNKIGLKPEGGNISFAQKYITAVGFGVLEGVGSKIQLKLYKDSLRGFKGALKNPKLSVGIRKGFTNSLKSTLKTSGSFVLEGVEESGVQLGGNFLDRFVLEKNVNLLDGVTKSGLDGILISPFYRAPGILTPVVSIFQTTDSNQKISQWTNEINEIQSSLAENLNMAPELKEVAEKRIVSLVNKISDNINKTMGMTLNMSEEDIVSLGQIDAEIFNLRKQQQKAEESDLVFRGQNPLLNAIEMEVINLSRLKNEILKPYIKQDNIKKIKKVQELSSKAKIDDNSNFYDNTEDFIKRAKELGIEVTGEEDALIDPETGEVLINVDVASETGAVSAQLHEYLHRILKSSFVNDPKSLKKIKDEFRNILSKKQLAIVEQRINENYRFNEDGSEKNELEYAEEYFTAFSDAVFKDEIKWSDNLTESFLSFGKKILEPIRKILGNEKLEFTSGRDVYDFIIDYNKNIKKGEITKRGQKLIERGKDISKSQDAVLDEAKEIIQQKEVKKDKPVAASKSRIKEAYEELQQIDEAEANFTQQPETVELQSKRKKELLKIVQNENAYEELRQIDEFEADFKPTKESTDRKKELLDIVNKEEQKEIVKFSKSKKASDEVQRLFDEKPRDWEMKVIEEFRPITAKLVERRRGVKGFDRQLLMDEIETGKRGIYDLIQAYDPSRGVPLSGFINTQLKNRMQEVSERILEKYYTTDVTEERGVSAPEDAITIEESVDESITPTKQEELNLRKKIKLPDEQVEKVREAVRKTFGTKLPPPNSPEFKKVLRKAFDTELFKELKTNVFKSRDDYKFFMSQNWKALYDAIPQQTLNQSFAPFREAVLDETGKQKREKTPEGERIFRKKNITKEEFLDYFFSPDLGVSTRGTRKDAIVRMMAQELGFDATMETIQEPKVVEKTEFVNPKITPQSIAPQVDRAIDAPFSKSKLPEEYGWQKEVYKMESVDDISPYIDNWIDLMELEGKDGKKAFSSDLISFSMLMGAPRAYFKNIISNENIDKAVSNKSKKKIKNLLNYDNELSKIIYGDFKGKETGKMKPSQAFGGKTDSKQYKKDRLKNLSYVQGFNKRNSLLFDKLLIEINNFFNSGNFTDAQKKKYGSSILLMLEATQSERNHALSNGAAVVARFSNDYSGVLEYEHAVPSKYVYEYILDNILKDNFENALKNIKQNFTVVVIPANIAKIVDKVYKYDMPENFDINKPGDWVKRYINPKVKAALKEEGIDPNWFENNMEMINSKDKNLFNPSKEVKASKTKASFLNKMIEEKTGILAKQKISAVTAAKMGEENRKIDYFIAPSAEDFMGLMYKLFGKGKLGDKQKKWVNENIMRPYAIGIEKITTARNVVTNSFQTIKKDLNITEKDLKKKIPNSVFTQEDALRVYIWAKQGLKIPGLLKKEQKELVSYINGKSNLVKLANNIIKINDVDFKTPTSSWQVGNLGTDMLESLNTTRRAEYLQEWQNNVDDIFSENNLNKLEAAFGKPYKLAVENSLQRMKTGRNRDVGKNNLVNRVVDWTNGATGAIMFFNTRSAILQLISAGNFINFGDNNIVAAGKAFANQKQYWSDVSMLFNSEFLVNRRDGLKMSVNEADIADVAREQGVRGLINKLLKLGFTPTQVADSIAIATGGATFYRNRYNALVKSGMNKADAEVQAMRDFRETAEESQQSSRPDKISQQQASELGRLILAFANTPSQYARIIKKAALDLKNRRGDDKENISKILYYTFAQNLIFNGLQNAMFAVAFGDVDDEDKLKKEIRVANGMADSLLRGMGIQGAILSVVKNAAIRVYQKEYKEIPMELFRLSPPISSKVRKIERASNLMSWEGDEIFEQGLTIDNPAIEITSKTVEALTNLPLDRALRKITNLKDATDSELEFYQRLALIGGWNKWDLGIQDKKEKNKSSKLKTRKQLRTRKQLKRK